jgi:hypothetical protein
MRRLIFAAALAMSLQGCSTTQKTSGEGLLSVVSQNVLRIAGSRVMEDVDFTGVKGRRVAVELTGFVEDRNRGFLTNLVEVEAESAGALLVRSGDPEISIEVAVNRAGNDAGKSSVPILKASRRTEATVDLTFTIRDAVSGERLSVQRSMAESKYEQSKWVGIIDGKGKYFVRNLHAGANTGGGIFSAARNEMDNSGWQEVTPQ